MSQCLNILKFLRHQILLKSYSPFIQVNEISRKFLISAEAASSVDSQIDIVKRFSDIATLGLAYLNRVKALGGSQGEISAKFRNIQILFLKYIANVFNLLLL